MKSIVFLLATASMLWVAGCSTSTSTVPNIVLIVADDLGWMDVGFMGSEYYETPNLDQLAGEGMVFQTAYAAAANCAPSRASLMTGLYTPRHGILTVGSSQRGDERTRRIIPEENRTVLESHHYTLAESLKDAGYTTCHIGKWHLGEDPRTQGMDYNVGGNVWGSPGSYFAPFRRPDLEAPEGEYLTDRLTSEALQFMQDHQEDPFFLYLPYYAVHTPIQSKKALEQKYLARGPEGCQGNAAYAGMVENLDQNIGLLLDRIRELGIEKNTLVIFTSDNGGIREISCQDPLRAGKGSYYEGGIRVPLVIRWPGKIKASSWCDEPVINLDFYPTLNEITGSSAGAESLDGLSLWPLLKGDTHTLPERSLYFHFPIYLQAYSPRHDDGRDPLFRTRPGSVIRKGSHKLHYYYEDKAVELYNLSADPGEQNDLSTKHPELANELWSELSEWLLDCDADREFQANTAYDPDFEARMIREKTGIREP